MNLSSFLTFTVLLSYHDKNVRGVSQVKFTGATEGEARQKAWDFLRIFGAENHQFHIKLAQTEDLCNVLA